MVTDVPAIDYTNKDFASLRQALLDLARYRLPEWTDRSPADLGVLLVDLFAYMGDVVLYYQDRIAGESFLHTATERRSVLQLLRLIGYELHPPAAATAALTLTFNAPAAGATTVVTLPSGAQFATKPPDGPPQTFEYLGPDLDIDLAGNRVQKTSNGKVLYDGLPVRHARLVPTAAIGTSTGEPNQSFPLSQRPVLIDTLKVELDEGAGFVAWDRRNNLLYSTDADGATRLSGPNDPHYYVQLDDQSQASVVFGDGVYGRRPAVGAKVRATYRVGGGTEGNVSTGAITDKKSRIPQLDTVTNAKPAVGGADAESIEHAVRFGPLAFRSGERAVTLADFVALAHQAGGVAKVRARASGWSRIDLYVAPEGPTAGTATPELKRRLVAFFADKRMVGTQVFIKDPVYVAIDIAVSVLVEHQYDPEAVRSRAEAAVRGIVEFAKVDFGQPLFLSKVYEAVEEIDGVFAATVSRFRREDVAIRPSLRRRVFGFDVELDVPAAYLRSLRGDIPPDGRIPISEAEIPTPGAIEVTIEEGAP